MILGAAAAGRGDKTPDAVDWGNISISAPDLDGVNANQTVQGFTGAITLKAEWTGSGLGLAYDINDGTPASLSNGDTFVVANGQTVSFTATRATNGSNAVTIRNMSQGGVALDSFNVVRS